MAYRVPEVLSRSLAALARPGDAVRGAVPLDELRMLDGDVGGPLLEVVDRIATLPHDALHQVARFRYRSRRIVDEARLRFLPLLDVALARIVRKRPELELVVTLLTLRELAFGLATTAGLLQLAVVLRAEAILQRARSTRAHRAPHHSDNDDRCHDGNRDPDPRIHVGSFRLLGKTEGLEEGCRAPDVRNSGSA